MGERSEPGGGTGLVELERRLGHFFGRPELLTEALTHASYAFEQAGAGLRDNERLEFLGDAVLELAVTDFLHRLLPQAREGRLTGIRASLVNEPSLYAVAKKIGLGEFVRLGRGEAASGGADKPSILSDALEAVLGAVYLDAGFHAACRVVDRLWGPLLEEAATNRTFKDHKTRLQELMQERRRITPSYRMIGSRGPDHERTFFVEARTAGEVLGRGEGRSKKEAEQMAAKDALENIAAKEPTEDDDGDG